MKGASERIVLIDLLRGFSILLVLVIHVFFGMATLGSLPFYEMQKFAPLWTAIALRGDYGVSIFFVLSGFLITGILFKPQENFSLIPLREFYVRRAGRILPLLALVCILGIVAQRLSRPTPFTRYCLSGPLLSTGFWLSLATFTFNWYRIAQGHAQHSMGIHWGVLWSLSIEEQFYVAYPLILIWLGSTRRTVIFLSLMMASGLLWRWLATLYRPEDYLLSITASFGAFDQIAAGCLLFFGYRWINLLEDTNTSLAKLFMVSGGIILSWALVSTSLYQSRGRIWGPSLVAVGVSLFLLGGLRFKIPENRLTSALCFPGQLSYGIYLLHSMVLLVLLRWLPLSNPWEGFLLFVALNVGVAALCFRFFEKPLNTLIRQKYT